jgi:AcrR family transcriptional regulator
VNDNRESSPDVIYDVLGIVEVLVMDNILAGLSYAESAKLAGISPRTVTRWMKEDHRFQKAFLRRLKDRRLQIKALRKVLRDDKTPASMRVNAVAMLSNLTTPVFDELGRPVGILSPGEVNRLVRRRTHERVSEFLLEHREPKRVSARQQDEKSLRLTREEGPRPA